MKKRIFLIAGFSTVLLIILLEYIYLIAPPQHIAAAKKEAKAHASEAGIDLTYEMQEDHSTREGFFREIYDLAVWVQNTRKQVNAAFGFNNGDLENAAHATFSRRDTKEELRQKAMLREWYRMRLAISDRVVEATDLLFADHKSDYVITSEEVKTCYSEGHMKHVIAVMKTAETGMGYKAYKEAAEFLAASDPVPMDVVYGIYPDLITAACEKKLTEVNRPDKLVFLQSAVRYAELFTERYDLQLDSYDSAKERCDRLEYSKKPDIPAVGMRVWEAQSTKLGASTRKRDESNYTGKTRISKGWLFWDDNGWQIFSAYYYDGKIKEVYDARDKRDPRNHWSVSSSGKTSKNNTNSTNSTNSTAREMDPDDYDIEGYYEDNRDLYDNYDDAYDGFMDDEDAWDDY